MSQSNFKQPEQNKSFPKMEEDIQKFWEENNIFEKSVEKNKNSEKGSFVFFEGPPTANGRPGIHHVLARAFKDIIPRFKNMQGYYVARKAGWDTHGLPVELEVEKKLKISGKPEIEEYGIEEFNKQCKQSVWEYKDEWEKFTKRIAFWLDLDNPYMTYDNSYIESLWQIIKEINEKDLLYEGYKVVPHCPRCATSLSSHEVSQGYEDVTEPSVYVKFKVKNEENTFILSWTTTPWTLPGNVGLAVGADIEYVKVKMAEGGENYILAKDLLHILDSKKDEKAEYEIVSEMKGEELKGIEYEPLFDSLQEAEEKAWYVMTADFVTTTDGTGVVHTAVMYGEDDYNLGTKNNLPKIHTVDENGNFTKNVKEFAGQFVKDAEKAVADNLKERGLLFKKENYTHSYPFCWRCKMPLLYYAKSSWFIKMTAVKQQLIENNKQINWVPDHIQEGRFGKWLENVKDWALSRERFWGTPLPVWRSESGEIAVIGSIEELRERAIDSENIDWENLDLHRPYIDDIKIKAEDGSVMTRDTSVLDCWFDSGSMPFAQHHYPFENKELVDSGDQFPADYISEAIDQTRGWFYTLLAVSTVLGKGPSYKNVICLGHINDKHGKKMSKSKGNVINPWDVINDHGVDALRWYLYTINSPGEPKKFDMKGLEEVVKGVVLKIWNVYTFFTTYANIDEFSPEAEFTKKEHVLDAWIVSKLESTKKEVTEKLEAYDIGAACSEIQDLIEDISNWYVRRSRRRFWKSENDSDKTDAYETLYYVLLETSKLMAPFTPFVADELYKNLNGKEESVHLESFPDTKKEWINAELNQEMKQAQIIVKLGHAARDQKKIKVRQPLKEVLVANMDLPQNELQEIVKEELNIKNLAVAENLNEIAEEKLKLNFKILGKKYGQKMKELHQAANSKNYSEKEDGTLELAGKTLQKNEFEKVYESKDEKFSVSSEKELVVILDTEITKDLEQEGVAREIVRHIQELRKAAGYNVDDRISVYFEGSKEFTAVIEKHKEYIQEETLSVELKNEKVKTDQEKTLEENDAWLGVKK